MYPTQKTVANKVEQIRICVANDDSERLFVLVIFIFLSNKQIEVF